MSEKKITLENCNFTKKHRINSPRSIQALKELGITYESLIKETFEDFCLKNEESKNLQKEILQQRYEHSEKKKEDLLSKAIEKRNEIIESQKRKRTNNNLSQSQIDKSKTEENKEENNENNENDEATAIKNQRIKLEKEKKKTRRKFTFNDRI